jgi:hypothetical protein
MFKALSDTLIVLAESARNVGDLAETEGDKVGTARLKVLLHARWVKRRRDGKAAIYSIVGEHVLNLIERRRACLRASPMVQWKGNRP